MYDPYDLLGIHHDATPDDIRAAYRRRAAECHPDHQPPEKRSWAEEQMKWLNEARDLLLDPTQRAKYDERFHRSARVEDYPPRRSWWPFNVLILASLFILATYIIGLLLERPNALQSISAQDPSWWLAFAVRCAISPGGIVFGLLMLGFALAGLRQTRRH